MFQHNHVYTHAQHTLTTHIDTHTLTHTHYIHTQMHRAPTWLKMLREQGVDKPLDLCGWTDTEWSNLKEATFRVLLKKHVSNLNSATRLRSGDFSGMSVSEQISNNHKIKRFFIYQLARKLGNMEMILREPLLDLEAINQAMREMKVHEMLFFFIVFKIILFY